MAQSRILGNYIVHESIGKGGMGVVFAGTHRFFGDRVAIKVLHAAFSSDPNITRRFFHEAQATRALDHPNLVKTLDFGLDAAERELYLVMELLEGESLGKQLSGHRALPEAEVVRIASAVADGLAAAHAQGIIHRDLKPSNVFLCSPDERVKLFDFGIAKIMAHGDRTGSMRMGTPPYMAPEQVRSPKEVGPATDIYSLGVLIYRMIAGRLPFLSEGIDELIQQHLVELPPPPVGSL